MSSKIHWDNGIKYLAPTRCRAFLYRVMSLRRIPAKVGPYHLDLRIPDAISTVNNDATKIKTAFTYSVRRDTQTVTTYP